MGSDITMRPRPGMPEAVLEAATSMLATDTTNMFKKINDVKNATNNNIMDDTTDMKEMITTVLIAEEVILDFNSEAAFRESRKKE